MKRDIVQIDVTDVGVAVAPRDLHAEDDLWDIYLINLGDRPMENVLITSQGYGSIDGVDKTTTVLRHFHQELPPRSFLKVEPIHPSLFGITNEYWVSFNSGELMLDKKYYFQPGEIVSTGLSEVPVLGRPGFMQR